MSEKFNFSLDLNKDMYDAIVRGCLADVVMLIEEYGVNPHYDGDKALMLASYYGCIDIVKHLVDINECNPSVGLVNACTKGHLEVVKFLVSKGVDIHYNSDHALRNACGFGYLEIAKFLLENGADINALHGEPLLNTLNSKRIELAKYLIKNGTDISDCLKFHGQKKVFNYAMKSDDVDIMRQMLNNGLELNEVRDIKRAKKDGYLKVYEFLKNEWEIRQDKFVLEKELPVKENKKKMKV